MKSLVRGIIGFCFKQFLLAAVVPVAFIIAVRLETPEVIDLSDLSQLPPIPESYGEAPDAAGNHGIFDRAAFAYDFTNRFMSLGLDQIWRKALVQDCLRLQHGDRVLDLATGTGYTALQAADQLYQLDLKGTVLAVDASEEMLRHGVAKLEGKGLNGVVQLLHGNAQDLSSLRNVETGSALSIDSESVDKISMSFGIRNMPNCTLAFREMRRALSRKQSSRVCILDFTLPSGNSFLSRVARGLATYLVPLAVRVAFVGPDGNYAMGYRQVEASILKSPQPLELAALMHSEGLLPQSITSFAFGAVHIYRAAHSEAPQEVREQDDSMAPQEAIANAEPSSTTATTTEEVPVVDASSVEGPSPEDALERN